MAFFSGLLRARGVGRRLSPRFGALREKARRRLFSQWKFEEAEIRKAKEMTGTGISRKAAAMFVFGSGLWFGFMLHVDDELPMKLLMKLDPETAHNVAVWAGARNQLVRTLFGMMEDQRSGAAVDERLTVDLCGMTIKNCLGLAAGFDKNGEAMIGMLDTGFGFVELGTVTPEPQAGNPKPRVFRLPEHGAVINRYGFNSDGHEVVRQRLEKLEESCELFRPGRIIGVNIGKNKTSPDAIADYVKGVERLGKYADYLVVNVSSPNTPGLRDLQNEKELTEILTAVIKARDALPSRPKVDYKEQKEKRLAAMTFSLPFVVGRLFGITPYEEYLPENLPISRPSLPPVFVKIAPDIHKEGLESIASVVTNTAVDGIVISNTTVRRDFGWEHPNLSEKGGLSGAPLTEMSTKVVSDFYRLTDGKVPIIGVGGISSGKDAFDKIKAGASVVQIYTGLIYGGPGLVKDIKLDLVHHLEMNGFNSVQEAVGADHRRK